MTYQFFLMVFFSVYFLVAADAQMDPSCIYQAKLPALGTNSPSLNPCFYKLFIHTGDKPDAGTDSKIGIQFDMSPVQAPFVVRDLTKCGGIWAQAEYFQRNQTNGFLLRGPCFLRKCTGTLMSDGSGQNPNWYVESVTLEISSVDNVGVFQGTDMIEKWLSPANSMVPVDFSAGDILGGRLAGFCVL